MPGKLIPCALCQEAPAVVYCVNDDANLCTACDTSVHASNPLLARHERRQLSHQACTTECASVAHTAASSDAEVGVVPQFGGAVQSVPATAPEAEGEVAALPAAMAAPAWVESPPAAAPQPAPLSLYEDSFLDRSLTTNDLLDLDDLELPGASPFSASCDAFDPLDDCVVPIFGGSTDRSYLEPTGLQSSFSFLQPGYLKAQQANYLKAAQQQQQPAQLVPLGVQPRPAAVAAVPQPGSAAAAQTDAEAEAERVRRHRERQRKKRAFGRAVRYASRRAYAEIRPRIKGRFVTPEEFAAYQAQAAAEKGGAVAPGPFAPAPLSPEAPSLSEDAVVPAAFVAGM